MKLGRPALVMGLILLAAPNARAQMQWTDKLFVNVNGGYQVASTKEFTSTSDFTVYDEPANLTATQELKSGPVFDGSVGYRVWKNLAVGVGVTYATSKSDVAVAARIPHPLFFDQFRVANVTAPGAKHKELQTHIQFVWFWPFTDKIDFAFAAGPSFLSVSQEVISGVTIAPESGPSYTSPQVSDITVSDESKTAFGVNFGADMTYKIARNYGVGFGVRYVLGSADVPGLNDSMTVGGFQVMGGLRVRY